jgi:hypothetical protein
LQLPAQLAQLLVAGQSAQAEALRLDHGAEGRGAAIGQQQGGGDGRGGQAGPAPHQPGPYHQHHQGIPQGLKQGLASHVLAKQLAKAGGVVGKAAQEPGLGRCRPHGLEPVEAIADGALQGAIELALQAAQPPAAGALQQGRHARGQQGEQHGQG